MHIPATRMERDPFDLYNIVDEYYISSSDSGKTEVHVNA